MPFTATKAAPLPGVVVIEPRLHPDSRGLFFEMYKRSEFEGLGISAFASSRMRQRRLSAC